MFNRWRAKIDWKEVYNVRDPPRMGDQKREVKRKKKGEDSSNLHDFGNFCNLVLKKEEETLSSSDEAPKDKISCFSLYPCHSIHT